MAHSALRTPAVLLSLLASLGCHSGQEPCTEGCPDISGVYAIQNTTPVGECAFSPYLLAPSVSLTQSSDGQRVTLTVIDPSTQLEVPLTGNVYAPREGDPPELVGSFRIETRTARPASRSNDAVLTLDVSATGFVSLHDERRRLSATLRTQEALSNPVCVTTLSVTGQGG